MKEVQRVLLKNEALMSRSRHISHDLIAGPPPEVLGEVDAAWERAQELVEGEFELHFELDEVFRRVTGELRLPDGTVVGRLSATEALAIACGGPVAVRPPALAV